MMGRASNVPLTALTTVDPLLLHGYDILDHRMLCMCNGLSAAAAWLTGVRLACHDRQQRSSDMRARFHLDTAIGRVVPNTVANPCN